MLQPYLWVPSKLKCGGFKREILPGFTAKT